MAISREKFSFIPGIRRISGLDKGAIGSSVVANSALTIGEAGGLLFQSPVDQRAQVVSPVRQEAETNQSVGVILLIAAARPFFMGKNPGDQLKDEIDRDDPYFAVVRELTGKKQTLKEPGMLSTPAETRKEGESLDENVLGALAEFGDPVFHNWMIRVPEVSDRKAGVMIGDNPIDVVVLIYNGIMGAMQSIDPICKDEVEAFGWVRRSRLLEDERLRRPIRHALEFDLKEGLVRRNLEAFLANGFNVPSVFPKGFVSLREYYETREGLKKDVDLPSGWKDVEDIIPEVKDQLMEVINLLAEGQLEAESGRSSRDYLRESFMAEGIGEIFKESVRNFVYTAGIDKVTGLGMAFTLDGFRNEYRGLDNWRRKSFIGFTGGREPDTNLYYATESVVEGYDFKGIKRADLIGYPELGKNWYLAFEGVHDGRIVTYLAPVTGIKDIQLKPFNTSRN